MQQRTTVTAVAVAVVASSTAAVLWVVRRVALPSKQQATL